MTRPPGSQAHPPGSQAHLLSVGCDDAGFLAKTRKLTEDDYDLAIVDINMPVMDGLALTRGIPIPARPCRVK